MGEIITSFDVDGPEMFNEPRVEGTLEVIVFNCRRESVLTTLTVGDGLKKSKCVSTAIFQICQLSSLLLESALF